MRKKLLGRGSTPVLSLESASAEFLAFCKMRQMSPATTEWYDYCLRAFTRFAVARGETDVAAVTHRTVRAFLAEQSEQVQATRLNHYREAIERLFNWLIAGQYVKDNPTAGIPKAREGKTLIVTFSEQELEALLAQPDAKTFVGLRDHMFMLTLLDTGIRLSEALGLRVEQVDVGGHTMKVLGKGNKERMVAFYSVLERHLRKYITRLQSVLAAAGMDDSPWLFPQPVWWQRGSQRLSSSAEDVR